MFYNLVIGEHRWKWDNFARQRDISISGKFLARCLHFSTWTPPTAMHIHFICSPKDIHIYNICPCSSFRLEYSFTSFSCSKYITFPEKPSLITLFNIMPPLHSPALSMLFPYYIYICIYIYLCKKGMFCCLFCSLLDASATNSIQCRLGTNNICWMAE